MSTLGAVALPLCLWAASAGGAPGAGTPVLYMADSRLASDDELAAITSIDTAPWQVLSAAINIHYARQHGYEFTFYHLGSDHPTPPPPPPPTPAPPGTEPTKSSLAWLAVKPFNLNDTACWHPLFGQRHPAHCKILPLHDVVESRVGAGRPPPRWAIFFDTDVVIADPAQPIDRVVAREGSCDAEPSNKSAYGPVRCSGPVLWGSPKEDSVASRRPPEMWADLLVCFDLTTQTGNTGVQFWGTRRGGGASSLGVLSEWWNTYDVDRRLPFGGHVWSVDAFPWEQHTFNQYVWPTHLDSVGVMRTAAPWLHVIHFFGPEARKKQFAATAKGRMGDAVFLEMVALLRSSAVRRVTVAELRELATAVSRRGRDGEGLRALAHAPNHVRHDASGRGSSSASGWWVVAFPWDARAFASVEPVIAMTLVRNGTKYLLIKPSGPFGGGATLADVIQRLESVVKVRVAPFVGDPDVDESAAGMSVRPLAFASRPATAAPTAAAPP